jgi:hypothetical protein
MKLYNRRQPDKGGIQGSAKATISLPIAHPLAEDEPKDKPSETSEAKDLNRQSNGEGHKGSVRSFLVARSIPMYIN